MLNIDLLWQDAPEQDRREVVKNYNLYYAEFPIPFEICDQFWHDSRFITIKYTFGTKPVDMVG